MTIERSSTKEYGLVFSFLIVTILFSLYLHLIASQSGMHTDNEAWVESYYSLVDVYPYNIRIFQLYSMTAIHNVTGLSLKVSFYLIQYLLAFFTGLTFYRFLKKLSFNRNWSITGMTLLMLAFPIAAAHFEPVHTRDDIWMYLFTVLTFSALLDRNWFLTSLFFTLGCFAREQMLLFYPVLLFEAWRLRKEENFGKLLTSLLLPIIVYGSYYGINYEPSDPKRWTLITYNFANSARTADSTVSLCNAFGFVWIPAIFGAISVWNKKLRDSWDLCLSGAIVAVVLTLILGIFFTLVRETRILFPPFIFVIPLAVYSIREYWRKLIGTRSVNFWLSTVIITAILIALGILVSQVVWPPFEYSGSAKMRRDFAGVNIGLMMAYLFLVVYTRYHKTTTDSSSSPA